MSAAIKSSEFISVENYLKEELTRQVKHELIDGNIDALDDVTANHNRISINLLQQFGNHLENSPCEPFGSMKLRVKDNFFYPDVMVDCQFDESEPYYTETPVLIVEVLSQSTRKKDETLKLMTCINLPSLQEYVLIEQDIADIIVLRRRQGWLHDYYLHHF